MNAEERSAEQRIIAAKQEIASHLNSMKHEAAAKLKSPYVIGGAMAAAATAGFVVANRKPQVDRKEARKNARKDAQNQARQAAGDASQKAKHGPLSPEGMDSALKWAQRLMPLLGAAGAMKAKSTPPDSQSPLPVAVPVTPPKKEGDVEAALAVPQGNWLKRQWALLKVAVKGWSDDYAPSMGAALSYYTLFSLAPLLIIVIGVAGLVFGQDAAQGQILEQLRGIMGEEGAVAVEGIIKAAREPSKGIFATIGGILLLLLGATAVFAELQSSLDRIWRTPAPPQESGLWHMLRTRVLSFGLVLGFAFMLMVSLVVSAALAAFGKWWGGMVGGWDVLLEVVNFVVSFGIFTGLFAMIYKLMPRAKIAWGDVWMGAAVTALLFSIGKVLIGLYLGKSSLASGFGAAGSLVVLLAWVYYSAQIFLLGAEYTWAYARSHGSRSSGAGSRAGAGAEAVPTQSG